MTVKYIFPLLMMFPIYQLSADQSDFNNSNAKDKSLKVIINEFTNTSNEEFNAFLQEKRNEMLSSVEQRFLSCDKDNDDTLDVLRQPCVFPR